ncbi:hypothetical protein J1TS5_03770 [Paenibacillus macerans]|uniref:hypothetical protein n=1 Tax=Paenibacillus macerans TaxID=44252 RepID=UPI001B0F36F3|nr:hypothetical protein [Paenibacillus macerans]GIP08207.1 hypothetical protein J1TS5_03770 [Paenibacillus macerans]
MLRSQLFIKLKRKNETNCYDAGYVLFNAEEELQTGKRVYIPATEISRLSTYYPELKKLSSECVILKHNHCDGMHAITVTDHQHIKK